MFSSLLIFKLIHRQTLQPNTKIPQADKKKLMNFGYFGWRSNGTRRVQILCFCIAYTQKDRLKSFCISKIANVQIGVDRCNLFMLLHVR